MVDAEYSPMEINGCAEGRTESLWKKTRAKSRLGGSSLLRGKRGAVSTTLILTVFSVGLIGTVVAWALYQATPAVVATNAGLAMIFLTSSLLIGVAAYALTAAEYLLLYYIFRRSMNYISNRMNDYVDFLLIKGGESPLLGKFARRFTREVPFSSKLLWYLAGWRFRKVAVVVLDAKPVRIKTIFRQFWIPLREGTHLIGGGMFTDNMLRADNWSNFLKKRISGAKHIVVVGGLGGSHGSTVTTSRITSNLIQQLGCKIVTFVLFSNRAILEQLEKSRNLSKWTNILNEDVESPMHGKRRFKVIVDYEGKMEENASDDDVAEFLTLLALHYGTVSETTGDDYSNLVFNLSSRVVALIRLTDFSNNPEVLSQEIPEKFKLLGERLAKHVSSPQPGVHVPPEAITQSFASESASIFGNPSDSEASARARDLNLGGALDDFKQRNNLRMSVRISHLESSELLLLIPISSANLKQGVWWFSDLREEAIQKLTVEQQTREDINPTPSVTS